jgi:hypothetical protein
MHDGSTSGPSDWSLDVLGDDGALIGSAHVGPTDGYFGDLLIDTANDRAFAWDATTLTLIRIDLTTLAVVRQTYDPLSDLAPGEAPDEGHRTAVWRAPTRPDEGSWTQMAGTTDGRIYALGFAREPASDRGAPPSLGVFVFDPETLARVDRWAPQAHDDWVQPILGGSYLAIGSQAGVDAQGFVNGWEATLAVHDPVDGRMVVLFGQLGGGR